jgi:hypothetical protein
MIFNIIDKNKFKESDSEIIFYNEQTNSSFAELIHDNYSFKTGWDSDLIKPKVLKIESNIFAIGIDQNFAIIDFKKEEVLLKLELFYSFYDIKIHKNEIYICTELEILVLNKFNYTTLNTIALPEFYEEINFEDNAVIIKCIDGFIVKSKS